jgi:DNA-binding LacI/PurR family transcriptional regulator
MVGPSPLSTPNKKIITIHELAELANVSSASISRALAGLPGVSEATRERIQRLAEATGYQPNFVAKSLSTGRSRRLALIASDLSNANYIIQFHEMEKIVRQRGYELLVADSERNSSLELAHIERMRTHQVEGILIYPVCELTGEEPEYLAQALRAHNLPVVVLGATPLAGMDNVGVDETYNGSLLGQRLRDLGHRSVLILAHDHKTDQAVRVRVEGLKRGLGPGVEVHIVDSLQTGWIDAAMKLIAGTDITACVSAGGRFLFALYRPLIAAGRLQDLTMVSMEKDDFGNFLTPAPAQMCPDIAGVAREAASLLLERIQNPRGQLVQIRLKGCLDEGETFLPPPKTSKR